ncbi:MAG: hypothetical protein C0465_00920 [Ralstonia sp.]|nr:hypothetical protein [Ralstonia sp.]POH85563.1 hypothetical protein CJ026_000660 [Ralstonia pickettii]MBA4200137.1 hypothetical protein [Ralstonia sp.]MBA4229193.1 hypothetical protein [Ralstonia sp.]MBA4234379.1 hypothetical protein [Ralstonia sp.]
MPPSPHGHGNSRSLSPHRARLSLLTFFGKTKKVSQPRQGMKQRMHQQSKTRSSTLDHQNTTTGDPSPFLQETKT